MVAMGLQRHTNDIFARPFDQELIAPPRRGPGSDGANGGAKAAAEAANIAASLGGFPDLGLPPVGAFQSGGGHISNGVNGVGQVGNQQGYSVLLNNTPVEPRVQDRISDVSNAPPPLPRLAGAPSNIGSARFVDRPSDMMIGGEARFEKPVEATMHAAELALAAAHHMAAAERERGGAGSTGSSWVAPPIELVADNGLPTAFVPPLRITDPGVLQPQTLPPQAPVGAAPYRNLSNVFCADPREAFGQQQASSSAPPAPWDMRQASVEHYLQANGGRPPFRVEYEAELHPSAARQPVERTRPMTPPPVMERPMTPRQFAEQGQVHALRQMSMPQLGLDTDRAGRSRSMPMTPNSRGRFAGYLPATAGYMSPVPAVSSYTCPVWPPPPLPPISGELTARLDALEAQKNTALDRVRETRLEKIRGELEIAQAAASQCKLLEQQLEQCNAEWKVKFDLLEVRCKQSEAAATGRIAQAVRDAETRSREELEALRKELQVVRSESDRALDESQLRSQERIDRLKRELEEARMSQHNDQSAAKLRAELENAQDEVRRRKDELEKLELENIGLTKQLKSEKVDIESQSFELRNRRNTYEVELNLLNNKTEDLLKQIRLKSEQKNQLEQDLVAIKNASKQREEECNKLRQTLKDEKNNITALQAEVQSSKAAIELDDAKERLFSPRQSLLSSPRLSPRQSLLSGASQGGNFVDLTEDMEMPPRRSSASGDAIRRQLGSQESSRFRRQVVDLQEGY